MKDSNVNKPSTKKNNTNSGSSLRNRSKRVPFGSIYFSHTLNRLFITSPQSGTHIVSFDNYSNGSVKRVDVLYNVDGSIAKDLPQFCRWQDLSSARNGWPATICFSIATRQHVADNTFNVIQVCCEFR